MNQSIRILVIRNLFSSIEDFNVEVEDDYSAKKVYLALKEEELIITSESLTNEAFDISKRTELENDTKYKWKNSIKYGNITSKKEPEDKEWVIQILAQVKNEIVEAFDGVSKHYEIIKVFKYKFELMDKIKEEEENYDDYIFEVVSS